MERLVGEGATVSRDACLGLSFMQQALCVFGGSETVIGFMLWRLGAGVRDLAGVK